MAKRIGSRPGSVVALAAGAALLALFFFPWIRLESFGVELATASGRELSQGALTSRMGSFGQGAADPRPWFWLGAVLPGLVLGAGALGAAHVMPRRKTGSGLVLLALVGAGVTLLALGVRYEKLTVVETKPTTLFWVVVGLHALTALGGLMEVAVSMAAGERSARARRKKGTRS